MNKFLQVLLGLTSFVWLVIGCALIAGIVLLIVWNPIAHIEKAVGNIPNMLSGSAKSSLSGGGITSMLKGISPSQVACAQKALGQERFQALASGKAQPTGSDLTTAIACLQ